MRFQHFDSLYITTPRVSAAMTARRQKVCLIRSVQPMNRSTSAAGDRGDGLTLQDDSSAHVSAGRSEENIAREGAVQSRAARVGRGAERAERERERELSALFS